METITNDMDVIDSRDIVERMEDIEFEVGLGNMAGAEEYSALKSIVEQATGCGDFKYGEGLIHESFFTEYCEQLCVDIGDISADLPWYIESNIDWDGVAENLKTDYMEIDFDGATYFMRA